MTLWQLLESNVIVKVEAGTLEDLMRSIVAKVGLDEADAFTILRLDTDFDEFIVTASFDDVPPSGKIKLRRANGGASQSGQEAGVRAHSRACVLVLVYFYVSSFRCGGALLRLPRPA